MSRATGYAIIFVTAIRVCKKISNKRAKRDMRRGNRKRQSYES